MKTWVPVTDGVVVSYAFQASDEYIEEYAARVVDPEHITTPNWYGKTTKFVDVSSEKNIPTIGSVLKNGKWIAPPLSAEEQERQEALQIYTARKEADDSFVSEMRLKIESGDTLTEVERDRLSVIQAERGALLLSNQ